MARDIVGLKINADLLDGLSASDFAQVSGSATFSGSVTATDLVVDDGGTIGSATTLGAITIASNGQVEFTGDLLLNNNSSPAIRMQDSSVSSEHRLSAENEHLILRADVANVGTASSVRFEVDGTLQARLQSDGDFDLFNGNLLIGTSGNGIDFSATSDASGSTSELLDDYEEGTWTAELTESITPATSNTTATGVYTKLGRQVTVTAFFADIDTTGMNAAGTIRIQLPFTASGNSFFASCVADTLDLPTNSVGLTASVGSGSPEALIRVSVDNAADSFPTWGDVTSGTTDFGFTLTYFV